MIPGFVNVQGKLPRAGRLGSIQRCLFDGEYLSQFAQQVFLTQAIEILDDAIVVEDLHLVMREQYHQKIIIGFLASVIWILLLTHLLDSRSCSRPVMAIGHIERFQIIKSTENRGTDKRVIDHPEHMSCIVSSLKIINRISFNYRCYPGIDL